MIQPDQTQLRIARCHVGARSFGINFQAVIGIQSRRMVQMSSESPTVSQIGVIATQGMSLPVHSLARLIGQPDQPSKTGHVLIVDEGEQLWGLLVDQVSQAEPRHSADLFRLPLFVTGQGADRVSGAVCDGDDQTPPLIVLDPIRLRPQEALSAATMPNERGLPDSMTTIAGVPTPQIVTCDAADGSNVRLAFSLNQLIEVTRVPAWEPLPWGAAMTVGMSCRNGRPLPLVDPLAVGGQARIVHAAHRVAVVRIPESSLPIGVIVGLSCHIDPIAPEAVSVAPPEIGLDPLTVRAAFRTERGTLVFPRFVT